MSKIRNPKSSLALVLRRLQKAYGRRKNVPEGSAVGELVGTILSQNTSHKNSSAGYRQLWRRFRSWKAVANAPVAEIERCIRVSGLSQLKAPRIKAILNQIPLSHPQGRLSLDFLTELPIEQAMEYLQGFEGIGPKTAACVLMFAFDLPVFPVDTHIHRIAIRLGLLDKSASAVRTQEFLTPLIPPKARYETHVLLIEHGRKTCRAIRPLCDRCALADICPSRRRGGQRSC
jgi:endonuclease-3